MGKPRPRASRQPTVSNLHWHAEVVSHLAFTGDGAYLLSGGQEAVLVVWQLSGARARAFVPRMGAEILTVAIAPDDGLYAVALRDNTVHVLSAVNLKPVQAAVGLRTSSVVARTALDRRTGRRVRFVGPDPPALTRARDGALAIDPRNHLAVVPGAPGCLQFFDFVAARHVFELEAAPQNHGLRAAASDSAAASRRNGRGRAGAAAAAAAEGEDTATFVDHVAFSRDGSWMATVDVRPAVGEYDAFVNLKLWTYDANAQKFLVNTRIESPHSARLTALCFVEPPPGSGLPLLLATVALDGDLKIWQLLQRRRRAAAPLPPAKPAAAATAATSKRKPRPGAAATASAEQPAAPRDAQPAAQWVLRAHRTHRGLPARDVQPSRDSSLLAVAAGPLVALWDPWAAERRAVLAHPPAADPLHRVAFVDVPRAVWARDPAGLLRRLRAAAAADGDQSDEDVDGNDDDDDNDAAGTDARRAWARGAGAVLPYLVAVTARRVHVWDLASGAVAWSAALPGSEVLTPAALAASRSLRRIARTAPDVRLVADPHAAVFAIVVTEPVREAAPAAAPAAVAAATAAPAADGEDGGEDDADVDDEEDEIVKPDVAADADAAATTATATADNDDDDKDDGGAGAGQGRGDVAMAEPPSGQHAGGHIHGQGYRASTRVLVFSPLSRAPLHAAEVQRGVQGLAFVPPAAAADAAVAVPAHQHPSAADDNDAADAVVVVDPVARLLLASGGSLVSLGCWGSGATATTAASDSWTVATPRKEAVRPGRLTRVFGSAAVADTVPAATATAAPAAPSAAAAPTGGALAPATLGRDARLAFMLDAPTAALPPARALLRAFFAAVAEPPSSVGAAAATPAKSAAAAVPDTKASAAAAAAAGRARKAEEPAAMEEVLADNDAGEAADGDAADDLDVGFLADLFGGFAVAGA
ncbi:hypothetical protein HK405_009259 [Cladochytrium tenue]|nr:hypothetical protein HK405_009259 [Cladochytrium tenue]